MPNIRSEFYRFFMLFLLLAAVTHTAAPSFAETSENSCNKALLDSAAPASVATVGNEPPKKSPLAPKPLPVRVVSNIYRWYMKKDQRTKTEPEIDFLNDHDFIQERRNNDKLGVVRSFFSKEFDTRIYYTATGLPNAEMQLPVVDPNSRAVIFYFHGSGTSKASGVNFSYKMNRLAALGYSVISIDLPFHAEGSRNSKMLQADHFYGMLRAMVQKYRLEGKPLYLAGHSFGPDIAAEFVKRFPFDADGIMMISPGSFNADLEDWFMHKTAHMTALWGDMVTNDDGAAWAGVLSGQHRWRKEPTEQFPDPTLVNPNLQIRIVSGEWEEYVPGPLDERGLPTHEPREYDVCGKLLKLFAKANCIIEPKVGHYIFEHKDANGHDVILREALALDKLSLNDEKKLKDDSRQANVPENLELGRRYLRESQFQAYVDFHFGGHDQALAQLQRIAAEGDLATARKLINDFGRHVLPNRERALAENIKKTAFWNLKFYEENQAEIDALDLRKPRPSDALLNKYFSVISEAGLLNTVRFGSAPAKIYEIPLKVIPLEHQKNRQQQEQRTQADAAPKTAA